MLRRRKRMVRYGLFVANFALLLLVILFVAKSPQSANSTAVQQSVIASESTEENGSVAPLDKVSSADIAVNVARTAGLPETTAVANQADSVSLSSSQAQADTAVVNKPQVISGALPSKKDIRVYTVVDGDTVSSIAAKLGVSSDSIRWSNGLTGERVTVGKQLVAPPSGVNGIVYTVVAGDTPDSLAQKYNTDKDLVISFNDAEVSGLKVGERILIPNGSVRAAAVSYSYSSIQSSGFAWGGNSPIYGRNGYDYGYCTWYVATRRNIPANWGNAYSWDSGALASGYTVSKQPKAGSILQDDGSLYGSYHVAYVESVNADGSILVSEMNVRGWGVVSSQTWTAEQYRSANIDFIY